MSVTPIRIGLILVLLVGLGWFARNVPVPAAGGRQPLSATVAAVLERCQDGSRLVPRCLKEGLQPLLRQAGPGAVLDETERIFRADPRISHGSVTCHDLAHLVGEAAVEAGLPVHETLRACTDGCGFGCTHGALFASIRRDGFDTSTIGTVCVPFRQGTGAPASGKQSYDACIHGLGHAVTELASHETTAALAYCDILGEHQDRDRCAAGVFMELIGSAEEPGPVPYSGMQQFCTTVPASYGAVCARQTGENSLTRTRNAEEALRECAQVPAAERGDCITGLANILYFQMNGETDRLGQFCAAVPPSAVSACLLGIIQSDVITDASARISITVCRDVRGRQLRNGCFRSLGEKMAYVYGTAARTAFCAALPAEESTACQQ